MTNLEHHYLVEIKEHSPFETRLYNLFKASISNEVSIFDFRKMFSKLEKMDVYIMKKNQKDIGLVYFIYCQDPANAKHIYIRPGIGIIEKERGAYFPKSIIMNTMIRAKLKNPFKKVFMVSVTMNPIVFISACKYWRYVYPKPTRKISDDTISIKNHIVDLFNLNEVRKDVIEIPFSLPEIEETKKKLFDTPTDNPYINYFTSTVKVEECNRGVLTIIPINLINLIAAFRRKTKADTKKVVNKAIEKLTTKEYSPV